MKTPYRTRCTASFFLGTFLSLAAISVHADPLQTAPPADTLLPPAQAIPGAPPLRTLKDTDPEMARLLAPLFKGHPKREGVPKDLGLLQNLALDCKGDTSYSTEVLDAKVTVQLKGASFLSALGAVMDASPKSCRIECRQVQPLRLSMNVTEAPVAGLLDSLAKLGGARLYVLPSKLIIAPATALTEEEKKKAKPYGVLVTIGTLPDTPDARALTVPNAQKNQKRSILEFANTKISIHLDDCPVSELLGGILCARSKMDGHYGIAGRGPIAISDWTSTVSVNFQDVTYGEAIASVAHLIDCELYMTPTNFVFFPRTSPPSATSAHYNAQNSIPVFVPSSLTFSDPSANGS